ncbi:hypothetical protein [Pseudomonas sp. CGJS7]|uniref:hypothetical protein n=1 Tax=Pseudomonas sp. CGJS7 TaxID=3109348 RepID=UPI003009EE4B
MNIYKNLMFLHGHFVDPRDADDEAALVAQTRAAEPAPAYVPARVVSRKVQVSRADRLGWRAWLRLWPRETSRVDGDCGVRG